MAKKAAKKRGKTARQRHLTIREKVGQGVAGSAMLIGWCAFLYQMTEILNRHSDWAFASSPPGWAEVLRAVLYASIAFGSACFTNFNKMLSIVRGQSWKER